MKRRTWFGVTTSALVATWGCASRDEATASARVDARRPARDEAGTVLSENVLPENAAASEIVLVELFSSEGCSSCPPAEALGRDLDGTSIGGRRVVVLEYHVDYWDDLGWRDPFSHARYTARQRDYGAIREGDSIFTPEAVIDGKASVVATRRGDMERAIEVAARGRARSLQLAVGEGHVEARFPGDPAGLVLTVITGERGLVSRITRGENTGLTIAHGTVVRGIARVPLARSGPTRVDVPSGIDPGKRVVVATLTTERATEVLALATS